MSPELAALVEAVGLKAVDRAGWVRVGVERPESVAAHSWGVAWLVLVLLPDDLDRARALSYAVLHDLPEVRVGDLTPHDAVDAAEKHRREAVAMSAMAAPLPGQLSALWQAYEAQQDEEARFVRQLDRLDMAIQALAQALAGRPAMAPFVDSAAKVIVHPRLVGLLAEIRAVWPR